MLVDIGSSTPEIKIVDESMMVKLYIYIYSWNVDHVQYSSIKIHNNLPLKSNFDLINQRLESNEKYISEKSSTIIIRKIREGEKWIDSRNKNRRRINDGQTTYKFIRGMSITSNIVALKSFKTLCKTVSLSL